jgi:hypothetical protein
MKMLSAVSMMAVAYVAYCGPLTSDVQTKVDQEIQALTPEQRWTLDRVHPFDDWLRTGSVPENYHPYMRQDMIEIHAAACRDMEKDINKEMGLK